MRKRPLNPNGFDEAIRHYRNAKDNLGRCKVEDGIYSDVKPVREAFGTTWLAVDHAIKAVLRSNGMAEGQIPESWDALREAVAKRLAVHNGKLVRHLNVVYQMVHLNGYYRGAYWTPVEVKQAFTLAHRLIKTLSGRRIA